MYEHFGSLHNFQVDDLEKPLILLDITISWVILSGFFSGIMNKITDSSLCQSKRAGLAG